MRRLSTFCFGVIVGVVVCFAAINFHVVRARDGFHLIRKSEARVADAYVDVRGYSVSDWSNHPGLAEAIMRAGKQDILGDAAATTVQDGVRQALGEWMGPGQ